MPYCHLHPCPFSTPSHFPYFKSHKLKGLCPSGGQRGGSQVEMPMATPEEGTGAGRGGGTAVSSLRFSLALPPIVATQQHPHMSNTACRGEKYNA